MIYGLFRNKLSKTDGYQITLSANQIKHRFMLTNQRASFVLFFVGKSEIIGELYFVWEAQKKKVLVITVFVYFRIDEKQRTSVT